MKIVFLGDSLTWGGYGGNFVDEVQRLHPDHEFINEGHGGNTVINLLRRIEDVLARDPDGIFVMIGGNDAISASQPATRPYYEQVQKIADGYVTPQQFEQAYRDLLTQIQVSHVLAWVGLPPAEHNPTVVETTQQYNDIARRVANSFNIETLDLMAHFAPDEIVERSPLNIGTINLIGKRAQSGWSDYATEREKGGFTYTFDGLHLTPESAQEMAKIIAAFLPLT